MGKVAQPQAVTDEVLRNDLRLYRNRGANRNAMKTSSASQTVLKHRLGTFPKGEGFPLAGSLRMSDRYFSSASHSAANASRASWAVFSPLTTAVRATCRPLSISLQAATVGRALAVWMASIKGA